MRKECVLLQVSQLTLEQKGLCFVGDDRDPAIVTQHLGAPESVNLCFKTTRDVADMIRGKVWQYSIQQMAGVAQGDDYGRNTLSKRKRENGTVETFLIDFGQVA